MKGEKRFIEKALHAFADPCRMLIVEEINRKVEIGCGEAEVLTGLSQPTCSHHIKLLTESKLIDCRIEGRNRFISLNKNSFKKIKNYFDQFILPEML